LAFNLDIVIFLLCWPLPEASPPPDATIRCNRRSLCRGVRVPAGFVAVDIRRPSLCNVFSFLLLLLFPLLAPDFINVKKFDCNEVAFQGSVSIFAAANEDVCVQVGGCDVRIRPILLVDTENAGNQLTFRKQSGKTCLRKIRRKQRLALLLVVLHAELRGGMLTGLESKGLRVDLGTLLHGLLELGNLKRAQLLASKHLGACHHNLALRKLHELWLSRVLEATNRAHGLIHGSSSPVTWLKPPGILWLRKAAHWGLLLLLLLWLSPVAVECP